jgi:hypothetical protein
MLFPSSSVVMRSYSSVVMRSHVAAYTLFPSPDGRDPDCPRSSSGGGQGRRPRDLHNSTVRSYPIRCRPISRSFPPSHPAPGGGEDRPLDEFDPLGSSPLASIASRWASDVRTSAPSCSERRWWALDGSQVGDAPLGSAASIREEHQ